MSLFTALEAQHVEVYPGGGASVDMTVRNTGAVVNEYRLEVLGASAPWAAVEPAVLPLFPGNEGSFTVTWRPPRDSATRAGTIPFGLRAVPAEHPEDSRVEEGALSVGPFYAMGLDLVPMTSRGRFGGVHRVVVDNQSNSEAAVALTALDPDALLRFRFRPMAFRLAPGATRSIKLRVHPRRHKFRGHDEHRPFQVYASQQGQDPQRVDGALMQRALIAGWQFKVAVLAILLLLAGLFLANFRQGSAHTLADNSIPVPPVPVHLSPLSTTSLRMTWSNAGVNVFSGYEIQSAGQTVASPSGDETAHIFTGLNPGQRYCYVIRSLEPKNSRAPASAFSPPVCASTLSPPGPRVKAAAGGRGGTKAAHAAAPAKAATVVSAPPSAPGAPGAPVPVTANVIDANDIRVTWTPHGGTGFVIQDSGQQVATPGATESSHTFSGLAANSVHCYVIWAVGPGGTSAHVALPCTTTIGVPGPPFPDPPTAVSATAVNASSIQVGWTDDASGVATGYQIFENGSLVASQPAGATGFTFTGLAPNSHHCYSVRSVTASNQSAFSPQACASVAAGVPPNVNLTAAGIYSLSARSITPSEGDGRAVVGAIVDYSVVVNVPISGVRQAVLHVSTPSGMVVQSNPSSNVLNVALTRVDPALKTDFPGGFAGSVGGATVQAGASGTPSGQVLSINLGDITNSSSDQTVAQTIAISVPVVVLNTSTNTDGTTLTVNASLSTLNAGASTSSPAVNATPVAVANPQPVATLTNGVLRVTLSTPSTGGVIYQPAYCSGPTGQATCTQITDRLASGTTATVSGVGGCPSIEWLTSTATQSPLSGGSDSGYAFPRGGPDWDPLRSQALPPGAVDSDVVVPGCSG